MFCICIPALTGMSQCYKLLTHWGQLTVKTVTFFQSIALRVQQSSKDRHEEWKSCLNLHVRFPICPKIHTYNGGSTLNKCVRQSGMNSTAPPSDQRDLISVTLCPACHQISLSFTQYILRSVFMHHIRFLQCNYSLWNRKCHFAALKWKKVIKNCQFFLGRGGWGGLLPFHQGKHLHS